jgi:flagellar motor switch protein FliM
MKKNEDELTQEEIDELTEFVSSNKKSTREQEKKALDKMNSAGKMVFDDSSEKEKKK